MNNPVGTQKDMTPRLPLWSYQLWRDSRLSLRSRRHIEAQLIARALRDELFKQELIAHPKAMVERVLETTLSEDIVVHVVEETDNIVYLVLPAHPLEGVSEPELQTRFGVSLEDLVTWVLGQQRNLLLDEAGSIKLIAHAWREPEFKHELLTNPRATLARECEITVPDSLDIQMLAEDSHTLYLVLPRLVASQYISALQDAELDTVTGHYDLIVGASVTIMNCSSHTKAACCCNITN